MEKENDELNWGDLGGPAYPVDDGDIVWKGASKLDFFAAHALQGILSGKWARGVPIAADTTDFKRTAQHAYRYARAMWVECDKQNPDNNE